MYQAYDDELLNQKESKNADSARLLERLSMSETLPDTSEHPLYAATRRLVRALDTLEGNLKTISAQSRQDVGEAEKILYFERENKALREERESLNNSIAQLQRQYNDLQKVATSIYTQLDDSIERLNQLIEE